MLHLERINHKNIWDVIDLKVFKSQKNFVAPNWASIAEAYSVRDTDTAAFPFGIYNGKKPMGFLMIGLAFETSIPTAIMRKTLLS